MAAIAPPDGWIVLDEMACLRDSAEHERQSWCQNYRITGRQKYYDIQNLRSRCVPFLRQKCRALQTSKPNVFFFESVEGANRPSRESLSTSSQRLIVTTARPNPVLERADSNHCLCIRAWLVYDLRDQALPSAHNPLLGSREMELAVLPKSDHQYR